MLVLVRDRNEGKTTKLVEWVLNGRFLVQAPGWSRLLVTMESVREKERIQRLINKTAHEWGLHEPTYDSNVREVIHGLKKTVFSYTEVQGGAFRGMDMSRIEYCVDNVERLLDGLRTATAGYLPARVTFNGQLWV